MRGAEGRGIVDYFIEMISGLVDRALFKTLSHCNLSVCRVHSTLTDIGGLAATGYYGVTLFSTCTKYTNAVPFTVVACSNGGTNFPRNPARPHGSFP